MEDEREIDLYLAEQEFCEEMCEEVERLDPAAAVSGAVSAAALAAAVSAASEPSPAEPVSAAIKPSATVESMDELTATPSQYAMVVEESREPAIELSVAAGSEQEVADIGAALKVDLDTTPGDRQRLAMAESVDDEALRTGVKRSLAPAVSAAIKPSAAEPAQLVRMPSPPASRRCTHPRRRPPAARAQPSPPPRRHPRPRHCPPARAALATALAAAQDDVIFMPATVAGGASAAGGVGLPTGGVLASLAIAFPATATIAAVASRLHRHQLRRQQVGDRRRHGHRRQPSRAVRSCVGAQVEGGGADDRLAAAAQRA